MGLVTDDLTSLLTDPKEETEQNPFEAGFPALMRTPMHHPSWHHAVYRFRKWLRTTLTAHGEHGDGLTR